MVYFNVVLTDKRTSGRSTAALRDFKVFVRQHVKGSEDNEFKSYSKTEKTKRIARKF